MLAAEAEEAFDIVDADRMTPAERGDSRVPRRRMKLAEGFALSELPRERVLATARTDDQCIHERESKTGAGWFEGALKGRMQPV